MAKCFTLSLSLALFLEAAAGLAQSLTIGTLPNSNDYSYGFLTPPGTVADLGHPANGDATMNTVTIRWGANNGCDNSFKIKFFRPDYTSFGSYTLVAERGPFNSSEGLITMTLSPPVSVKKGDLIGVTELQPVTSCGGVSLTTGDSTAMALSKNGDISGGTLAGGFTLTSSNLNIRAGTGPSTIEGVIAAVGSVAGAFGSQFRTAVQLANIETSNTITGNLVFHPAGRPGVDTDPSLSYSLAPLHSVSYADLIASMGQSGLGSLDVVSTSGTAPLITTRVFNDAGAAGTSGFTEELVTPGQALGADERVWLSLLPDQANFRMNVGVRTLASGAQLRIICIKPDGTVVALLPSPVLTKIYQPNYFEQVSVGAFLNNTPVPDDSKIQIQIVSGSAIIYVSKTDNRTNDSSITFARRP